MIIVLSVLTFVPWKFVHPLRVKSFRNLTIFFTVVWAATTLRLVTKSEINLIVIVVLSVLTFVPWKFVHPLRVKSFRNLTIFFTVVWAATTLRLVTKSEINLIINDTIVLLIWLICTGYFIYICFLRSIKDY